MGVFWDRFHSPVGRLRVTVNEAGGLVSVVMEGPEAGPDPTDGVRDRRRVQPVIRQLEQYFAGDRVRFELELDPGGTAFQRSVWDEVARIPYGGTRSYGEVARRLGKPTAVRAVGLANGANPIPIVIPCHRVVGADGSLVGYGGGLHVKAALLEHEGVRLPTDAQLKFAFE
jgi:methylated-DNA-[protein]-cysteine S-methyltransferase